MKAAGIKANDMTAKDGIAGVIADLVRTQAGLDLPVRRTARSWSPGPRGRCAGSYGGRASSA